MQNAGPVKIVVSSTFEEIVLDETKDVILEVLAQSESLLSVILP